MPDDQRLPRSARLLKPTEFDAVFAASGRASSRFFTARFQRTGGTAKLGLAIARRSLPRAVDRNRIKRQLRESFRCHRAELAGFEIVIRCRPEAKEPSGSELRADIQRLWRGLQRSRPGTSSATPPPKPEST